MAVAPSAVLEFTCPSCGQGHRAERVFAGRRSLCVSCRCAITIPGGPARAEPSPDAAEALRPLGAAVLASKAPAWEVSYSRAVVMAGADEAAVAKALRDRHVASGSRMSSLPDILVARGIVDPDTSRQAIVAARLASGGRVTAPDEKYVECPNCFGYVAMSDRRCPYCGEQLASGDLLEICPNCKHQQPTGADTCASCHANMRTGLLPSRAVGACPRCGVRYEVGAVNCRTCGARLSHARANAASVKPGPLDVGRRRRLPLARPLASYFGTAVLLALVLGAAWAFVHRQQLLHGESGAALRQAVGAYCDALKYRDYDAMAKLMDPTYEATAEAMPALIPVVTGGKAGQEVLSIQSQAPRMEGDHATVYVDVVLKGGDVSLLESNAIETMEAINKLASGSDSSAKRVTWTWVQRGGAWYYSKPVSQSSAP